ncbi:hypothetical protein VMCG_07858 [Cytospora schulzeri]|uniref:Kinetochore protein mis13 n=1 Tax=Cytospora schulzeri TaxID=448051 RepID=A0A423W0H4_9PEZI|nr:hypothetical protein VMCG_07858 [Valsa malicola]
MGNQSEPRRKSKRLAAAAVYDEEDGDFIFTRGPKRQKPSPKEPPAPAPAPPPAPEPESAPIVKKPRGRPSNGLKRAASPTLQNGEGAPATTSKRPARRKLNSSPPPPDEQLAAVPKKRATRRTRSSMEDLAEEGHVVLPTRTNGAKSISRDEGTKKSGRKPSRKQQPPPPQVEEEAQATPDKIDKPLEKDPHAQKIALPFSDTPINRKNKEFRKKGGGGGGGGRRSSMSMRGRRASSLIESGHSAIPHREVGAAEFYKHIEAEGLSEPRRMKQLLTWCGERALSEKPKHGSAGAPAVLGARAIQDALLKDFGSRSEFSDWFSREDEPSDGAGSAGGGGKPRRPVVVKPNPINVEHEQKIAELEGRIKRLKETRKSWRALQNPLPQLPPLYPQQDCDPKKAPLPDPSLLDAEEARMLDSLTDPSSSFAGLKSTARSRLQAVRSGVEFGVDHLADGVHKMDLRVATAGRQADKVLALGAGRLREREGRERGGLGTGGLPTMEVLRSLSRILPENGGGG